MKSAAILIAFFTTSVSLAWDIDLSRRRKKTEQQTEIQRTAPQSSGENTDTGFLDGILPTGDPSQEIVILSTADGFVPKTVRVRKGQKYTIYVVNVNEKEKNVSFILDAFSEHHGTYFGKIKKFEMDPKKEGIYSFHCPETSSEGRLVVYTGESTSRKLSSQGE